MTDERQRESHEMYKVEVRMHFKKTTWIIFSGLVWFAVGMGLMTLGLNFIVLRAHIDFADSFSLISTLSPMAGGRERAAFTVIALGLVIGFIKGRFVLSKTVKRVSDRILSLPSPVKFSQVYSRGYALLIAGMVLLGMSMKWLGIPLDVRGLIDVAIGSALMNGSMAYFRIAASVRHAIEETKS